MFERILAPVINAVRVWMADRVYKAAKEGTLNGLQRFAEDAAQQFEALPAPAAEPLQALPMPSAAQTTAEPPTVAQAVNDSPAEDVGKFERAKELKLQGLSNREIARQTGVPESTQRGWWKRAGVE